MTRELHQRIEAMLAEDCPRKTIAATIGVPLATVGRVARGFYGNGGGPTRSTAVLGRRAKGGRKRHADPTPDEIEEMAYRLRRARVDDDAEGWTPPFVNLTALA